METRLKILISAYACEPGKGSEPEVGWQWALQAARFHEVTVLTRANNRAKIEAGIRELPPGVRVPAFIYHDEPAWTLRWKKRAGAHRWYYARWQRSAREVIARLHGEHRFEVLHHVTYVALRYAAAVQGHGVPCVWGPLGGAETIPLSLLPWRHPPALAEELARNALTWWQSLPFTSATRRARTSDALLAATGEMQAALARIGCPSRIVPAIGIDAASFSPCTTQPGDGPLRLLFVGRLVFWKGIDLAIESLHAAGGDSTLTVIGDGPAMQAAKALASRLRVASRVHFQGRLTRADTLRAYTDYEVFLYPSLHDSGAFTVLEAMACGLPVICLAVGGPALAVDEKCGVKVPLTSRAQVVARLAEAIRGYASEPELRIRHGLAARARVEAEFDWQRKGEVLDAIYRRLVAEKR